MTVRVEADCWSCGASVARERPHRSHGDPAGEVTGWSCRVCEVGWRGVPARCEVVR